MNVANEWKLRNFLSMYAEEWELHLDRSVAGSEYEVYFRVETLERIAEKMTELNARHLLHLRNPALQEAWDKYITMENLVNDLTRDDLEY